MTQTKTVSGIISSPAQTEPVWSDTIRKVGWSNPTYAIDKASVQYTFMEKVWYISTPMLVESAWSGSKSKKVQLAFTSVKPVKVQYPLEREIKAWGQFSTSFEGSPRQCGISSDDCRGN